MIKNNFRILKKQYAYLQTILKTPVKFEKDWPKTVGGVADTRMVVGADGRTDGRMDGQTDGQTDRRTDGRTDTQNFGGYNIMPRHFLMAGHNYRMGFWLSTRDPIIRSESFSSRADNGRGLILRAMTKTPHYNLFFTDLNRYFE